jgi:putative ABC transport system permease protein
MTMHASQSLYRVLLRLCPADLRAEFGAEMEALFLADLQRARGVGKLRVWSRAIADVLMHGLGARNDSWTRVRHTSAYVEYETGRFWMDTWRYDLRHALRMMSRQRGTTAIILLTLALAIGANTAVFSAVHTVLIRPLPYQQPESLVMLWEKREAEGVMKNPVSAADYLDWARLAGSFTAMAAFTDMTADLTGEGDPEKLPVGAVSPPFFQVFGVRPLHGRTLEAGEDTIGRHRVVVLGHALWRQRFGADAAAVGRTISLNGIAHQIVGVLPPDVVFPHGESQLFLPLILEAPNEPPSRVSHNFSVYARLKPGVTMAQALAEMDRIGKDLEQQYPQMSRGHGAHVASLTEEITGPVERTLVVLMAAVGFILLIACINVTNLLLAKSAGRRREMAVRSAIGAGRGRLIRQVLVECGVLAVAGGIAGLVLALWCVRVLAAQLPAVARPDQGVVFSVPVLLFTFAACVISGMLAGALPAWHLVREDPSESLKEGGRGPVSLKRGLRFGLIVAEVALTSLLLVGAGLTLRSFQTVLAQDPGIDTNNRLTFRIGLPGARYKGSEAAFRFFSELESRLAAEPTIRAVGGTMLPPLSGLDGRRGVVIENREVGPGDGPTRAHPRVVTSNYLQAIGSRVREGRGFVPSDTATSLPVAIVNETMAKRYWPGVSAIGGRVRFTDQETWREVVGIIGDVKHWGLDAPVNPELYVPTSQFPTFAQTFVLLTNGDPLALIPLAQRHVRELDPNLPLFQVRTMDDVAARSVERRRWTMTLLAVFAGLALVLAAAGIYGVMAHLVALRTPEIGVRLTLGAKPGMVMRQVLGEGAVQAAIGLAIGLAASLAMMQGLRTILFGVEPTDPMTMIVVGVSLMLVALVAVTVPAVRAMRIDPVTALRQ